MILLTTQTPATETPTLLQQLQSFIAGVATLDPEQAAIRGGLSVLVFVGGALLMWGLRLVLKTLAERMAPTEGAEKRKPTGIGRWTIRIARIAIFVTALLIILRVWGFELDVMMRGPIGVVLGVAWRIALIVVLSLAATELSQLAIRGMFNRVAERAKNIRRASQLRTLAPVLSGVAATAIIVAGTMMALSEVGVEIGPLLAGAGIVGLAVGFGAQTIVKDFLTGIFLIMEDAVSVGDIIKIGEFGGVVEEMSIRTIKLRDFDGTVHTFPYSEAQVISNRTKGFSFAVFTLQVAHASDVVKALDLMKQTGDEIKAEESFAPFILSPIEVVGVDQVNEAGVTLKARIKTAPGKQWLVQREYLRRIKLAFDAGDIDVAAKQTVLIMPGADKP
jgi:moderate conductance mechanosensitive channel